MEVHSPGNTRWPMTDCCIFGCGEVAGIELINEDESENSHD